MKFAGIPAGRIALTSVPNVVFSELLPLMDDASQIQVTLHIYYLLSQKKGSPRYVTSTELRGDTTLMQALAFKPANLKRGLDKAVAVGALIQAKAGETDWYFFNTAESRRAIEKITSGELELSAELHMVETEPVETPNIFVLYEQNIGPLTPMIAEELKQAEQDYPAHIILDAFRSAAENNKRSWRYVNKILLNWTRSNTDEKTRRTVTPERRPSITGKLADVAKPK